MMRKVRLVVLASVMAFALAAPVAGGKAFANQNATGPCKQNQVFAGYDANGNAICLKQNSN